MTKDFTNMAYVGTYTDMPDQGICSLYIDVQTGRLELGGVAARLQNPSYLAFSQDHRYLYSVIETQAYNDITGGGVVAFSVDNKSGNLAAINEQPTHGTSPCHVLADSSNKHLFTANYGDGTVTIFNINEDGGIGALAAKMNHAELDIDSDRIPSPHAHNVLFTPDERYLCAVDLGIDMVVMYYYDREKNTFVYDKSRSFSVRPGSGPRHMVFSQNGRNAYLINELSSELVALDYSPSEHRFTQLQCVSTLPKGYRGKNSCAAVHLSPDGRFLYASNRGHDSIAIYKIDNSSGQLDFVSHASSLGEFPRDFAIHPSGDFLIVVNQNSNNAVSYAITKETGEIHAVGSTVEIPNPVCLVFPKL